MIRRAPPIAWVAATYATGITGALLLGEGHSLPLIGSVAAAALILLSLRSRYPGASVAAALAICILAGALAGTASAARAMRDCRLALPRDWTATIEGRVLARPAEGSSIPFLIESGAPGGCREEVRAYFSAGAATVRELPVGRRIRVQARWEGRAFPDRRWPDRAGMLWIAGGWEEVRAPVSIEAHLGLRGAVQSRIGRLWGEEAAAMVEALVLARREHLDPGLRDAFARSGTAHLLAISGFHVGVVAVLMLGALRGLGVGRLRAESGAVLGCWLYVLGIGAPQAAVRAAVLMSLLLAARARGRPVSGIGTLAAGLLLILFVRPGWVASVGAQLSFAGTAGLILFRRGMAATIERRLASASGRASRPPRWIRGLAGALGAGIAATLATTPLVAWHFDRISLVGIPLTLVVGPLVGLAIPGIAAAVALSWIHEGPGRFLAGGVGLLLDATAAVVRWSADLPGASVWVSRSALLAVGLAGVAAFVLSKRGGGRVRRPARYLVAGIASTAAVAALPILPLPRSLEIHMIDVGQGDAIAVRLPSRRWILVDAGPRSPTFDAGERRVVPYLRREGARDLAALVLTHPHLDHIGGATAALGSLAVQGVMDPGYPTGSPDYLAVLESARAYGASWWPVGNGIVRDVDGVRVTVLHPDSGTVSRESVADLNDLSVVVLMEWGDAAVLLTGDASAEIEREVLEAVPRLTVLKVGHHGSRTSTSTALLEASRPPVALIGVGDGNRFGHPHAEVVRRLEEAGTAVYRTDRDGDIRIVIGRDGRLSIRTSR